MRSLRTKAMLAALTLAVGVLAACGPGEHNEGEGGPGPGPGSGVSMSLFAGSLKRAGSQDGTGEAAGFNLPEGVALDSAGNIYVADTGNHTIRKLAPDGAVTTVAGTAGSSGSADGSGTAARFSSPRGVAVDASGNLYVADTGNHTVRRIAPGGVVTTVAGVAGQPGTADGPAASARLNTPTDIAIGPGGVLYVGADSAVRKVTDGTVSTFAGSAGQPGVAAGDGPQARFTAISGVAVNASGDVYVSEVAGRLRRFDAQAKSVALGTVITGILTTPVAAGIAVDGAGNVYIASSGVVDPEAPKLSPGPVSASAVYRVAPQGAITLIAGSASGYASVTLTVGQASLREPAGIAADAAGRVVFSDKPNHSIRRIDAQRQLSTLAGGTGIGTVDGSGAAARFAGPIGLAAAGDGGLYVADFGNVSVRRISTAGAVSTVSLQGEDGQPLRFDQPSEVAANPQGGFYLVTTGGDESLWSCTVAGRCRALDGGTTLHQGLAAANGNLYLAEGTQASVIGSNGVKRVLANDFGFASAIVASPGGKVYVADGAMHTVRVFDDAGRPLQTVGTFGSSGYRDGAAAQAQFAAPSSLALDATGNLYIADGINNVVRKLSADGSTVSTVAGTTDKFGDPQMGPATGVLGRVSGMAWQNGSLYVSLLNAVVKISPVN